MRLTIRLFLLVTVTGLSLVLAGCGHEPEEIGNAMETGAASEVPAQQFFDYRLIESQAGVRKWILESAEMQKFTGRSNVILSKVHMDFYREGAHFSVLTADSGRANLQTNDVHTWGDVVLTTDDGRKLETSELFFNNETQLIHNDVFNRFTREFDVMTGIGLEATPDLTSFKLKEMESRVSDGTSLREPKPAAPDPEGGQK